MQARADIGRSLRLSHASTGHACTACRRKKIKCDSVSPVCAQCRTTGLPCRYVDAKKTGLPRGYVHNLEGSIESLKRENNALRAQLSRNQELWDRSPNEHPSSSTVTHYISNQLVMQDPFDVATSVVSQLLTPEDKAILREVYFTRCHPFLPILHEPTFTFTDEDIHIALSVFALAARHHEPLASKAEVFYSLAKQTTQSHMLSPKLSTLIALLLQVIYEIGLPNTSLLAVSTLGSALTLTSVYRLTRMDQEPLRPSTKWLKKPKDWVEEEGRRRVAWLVLSLSRWVATIEERELGIPARTEIRLKLPVSDDVWFAGGLERPVTGPITSLDECSALGPYARFVQVLAIYDMINTFQLSYSAHDATTNQRELGRIDETICKFLRSFPNQSSLMQNIQGQGLLDITTICLARTAYLLLHNSNSSKDRPSLHESSKLGSFAHAEEVLDILHAVQDLPFVGNYILPHCIILTSRVRLAELTDLKGHYRGRDMDLLVKCLETFGENWGLHDKLANHIDRIQTNNLAFSEPLTTFKPTSNCADGPTIRQRAVALVHNDKVSWSTMSEPANLEESDNISERLESRMASSTLIPVNNEFLLTTNSENISPRGMDWSADQLWAFEENEYPWV